MTGEARVIQIHLAGADWRLIHPLLDAGALPNLGAMVDGGSIGNVFTQRPLTSPLVEGQLATGRPTPDHGILFPLVADTDTAGVLRSLQSRDWQAPPVWEIAAHHGVSAAAVGWPASDPTQNFKARVVSDTFAVATGTDFDDWPLAPGSVNDAALAAEISDLRMHPADLTAEMILPLLPKALEVDAETDRRMDLLGDVIARTATLNAAATWIWEEHRPDLLCVHFDLLSVLSREFLQYRAPRMAHVTERDFDLYQGLVDEAYKFADLLLGRYLQLAGLDTRVMVVSGHGVLLEDQRPVSQALRGGKSEDAVMREIGMIAVCGPGIAQDEMVTGILCRDVAPTTLALLGLGADPKMPGQPRFVPAANGREMKDGAAMLPGQAPGDTRVAAVQYRRLAEMGLVPVPPSGGEVASDWAEIQALLIAMEGQRARGQIDAALAAAAEILARDPDNSQAHLGSIQCLVDLRRFDEAALAIAELRASGVSRGPIHLLEARVADAAGDDDAVDAALQALERSSLDPRSKLRLLEEAGWLQLRRKRMAEAERLFLQSLALDPTSASANVGLGRLYLAHAQADRAAGHLQASLAKLFHQPLVHLDLGRARLALQDVKGAEASFEQASRMAPDLDAPQKALRHLRKAIGAETIRVSASNAPHV